MKSYVQGGAEREGEGEEDSPLSAEPVGELNPKTLRSYPESKSAA